ncbi:MAG: HAMP domain-containing histidine kinase [Bacillus sp. (in: Bacteria)]|nr:HAMP domain-containing histidine kinase [Bacillus sp. (in: firmicutes)]MCM1425191.1 HAMP domain-containing histidine kinase [Eubacterium sp.]
MADRSIMLMRMGKNMPGIRKIFYYGAAVAVIAGLMLMVNFAFFILMLTQYYQKNMDYAKGVEILEELSTTEAGYALSESMQAKLADMNQWAMLLDENGCVIWSYRKPPEIKDSYSMAEIAAMSRWYLEDYPVYLRIWDEKILVTGTPRHSTWKYLMEFPISWMDYMKRVWYWFILVDFLAILVLTFFFVRRWAKSREQVRLEWIAGISHDIRTPLSMVMGYSDALRGSENLTEEERRQMAVIRHQSVVMKELVEDLNLTSRLEYSMQALRVEKVRPAAVLREAAAAFLSDAADGELEIAVEISEQAEGMWIKADKKLLIRAFNNLFHNSIQHGRQQETTIISLRMWKERRWCCISFSDNGTGYSREVLTQMRSRRKEHAELQIRGLGIVRKIVLTHGGKIRFANNGQGGCFCEMRFRGVK